MCDGVAQCQDLMDERNCCEFKHYSAVKSSFDSLFLRALVSLVKKGSQDSLSRANHARLCVDPASSLWVLLRGAVGTLANKSSMGNIPPKETKLVLETKKTGKKPIRNSVPYLSLPSKTM